MTDEIEAVRDRYARRRSTVEPLRYSMLRAANWQPAQERQRVMLRMFADHGLEDPAHVRLLEVGAGGGGNLLELLRLGFLPAHLSGVELLPDRALQAKAVLPATLDFRVGDASTLEIEPGSLDLVYQSVVFSSLLDDSFQERLARRMWSWLRPGGAVLWYDFTFNNPRNADVRGIPLARIRQLFPLGRIDARRVTLAPPIARRVCRVHPSLYSVCNALPLLRTHLLCWIEKP